MTTAPWHQLCRVRPDVLSGELTLAEFAADLYGVRTGSAPDVYRDAGMFFSRTYPTRRMKELVRDVLQRAGGVGGNPVLRLQVAYGGGKTHTLIALLHLAERAQAVSDNPTVKEFTSFAGVSPVPEARVAILPFDKLDIHDGLDVVGPDGKVRRVRTPWGALAYQLAGDAGYARVSAHEESYSTPAQPLLEELLKAPHADGKGALILVDEAVMYGRAAVNQDPRCLGVLKDFFQVLTQAVASVNRSCIVATLIASESEADDVTGAQVLRALEDVFGRLQSTGEPVGREDIAEVLRRRLFESVAADAEARPIIDATLATYADCSKLREAQKGQAAYDRLLASYPFHPDLIEVFYEKWTELSRFQRTRGALRLLAQAIRQGAGRDMSPLIGVGTLLGPDAALSPPVTELVRICSDSNDMWTPKLVGELERAREVQAKLPSLSHREIEQAVLSVFLHSQPPGRRADTADVYAMLVTPGADLAAIDTGLDGWRNLSWFLTEEPTIWRLTTQPNLTHVHVHMMRDPRVTAKVADELRAQIEKVAELAAIDKDGEDQGVRVHRLPQSPKDVEDNTDLHYLILAPECGVDAAQPMPPNVTAYFTTASGPQNPRTYRNSIVALAPDAARLAGLTRSVTELVAWQHVEASEAGKQLSAAQKKTLLERKKVVEENLPSSVRATYSVVLDMGEDGNPRAQSLKSADQLGITDARPFARIKAMLAAEERLVKGDLLPELLLPGSYYELWAQEETSKPAKDLLASFAQFPRLPRFLSAQVFRNALARGCEQGELVLRLPRPDNTARTFWRTRPSNEELVRTELQVVPIAHAELTSLDPYVLAPSALPGLWKPAGEPLAVREAAAYYDGHRAPVLQASVFETAVRQAVELGVICARIATRTYLREPLPSTLPTDTLELLPPPSPLTPEDLMPPACPGAWRDKQAQLASLWECASTCRGYPVPWALVVDAVAVGLQRRCFTLGPASVWPCGSDKAAKVILVLAGPVPPPPPPKKALTAEATLTPFELQKLGELVDQLSAEAPALAFRYHVLVTAEGEGSTAEAAEKLTALVAKATAKLRFE